MTKKTASNTGEQSVAGSERFPAKEAGTETETETEAQFVSQIQALLETVKPSVMAAHREYESDLVNAWKSEFQQALHRAASHLPSTKPRTQGDRDALDALIKSLGRLRRGRPLGRGLRRERGRGGRLGVYRDVQHILIQGAQRTTEQLVREGQRSWLEANTGRQRVPASVTDELIKDFTNHVSFQWGVDAAKIDFNDVRRRVSKK